MVNPTKSGKTPKINSASDGKTVPVVPEKPKTAFSHCGKWVIVQLTPLGEREKNINLIVRSAHRILGKQLEVFIPAVSQKVRDESQTMFYMDGYVFVSHVEGIPYLKLSDTMYFSSVLIQTTTINGVRKRTFSLLSDNDIAPMKAGMQTLKLGSFKEGQSVKIVKGNFKNLQAKVSYIHEGGESAQVHVKLRSKPILIDFPVSYLKAIEE
jgi:transcription antitermination factor NusG